MKKLIFILFLQSLYAQSLVQFDLSKSFISYDGKHPAHNWTGVSKDVQGTFEMNKQDLTQSKVDLYVPVFSFDSKNANRDSNMLDVVEEYYYPFVRFTSSKVNFSLFNFCFVSLSIYSQAETKEKLLSSRRASPSEV